MNDKALKAEKLLSEIKEKMDVTSYIKPEEVPQIDLYMDQVTTFMETALSGSKRCEEDKVLTKTMINNYAKNHLLPPPEKKKYSSEHLEVLTMIYYMKNILSIGDIQTLLAPVLDEHFHNADGLNTSDIYREIVDICKSEIPIQMKDAENKYQKAIESFKDAEGSDRDKLQLFTLVCLLCYDVFEKKQLIEYLIDNYFADYSDGKNKK